MKKTIYKALIALFAAGIISACGMPDPEVERTAVSALSGEWFIQYEYEDPPGSGTFVNPGWGHYKIITSNTAANIATEMLVDDHSAWGIKFKVAVSDMNFSATAADELLDGEFPVTVTNGVVIKDGGKSRSGVVTDSISYEFVQPDLDPTLYRVIGHKRTGFLEDEF